MRNMHSSVSMVDGHIEETKNEVIQARWEINCDGYYPYCTNCEYEPPYVAGQDMRTPYCPNCGAKMNKRSNNG